MLKYLSCNPQLLEMGGVAGTRDPTYHWWYQKAKLAAQCMCVYASAQTGFLLQERLK